MSRHRAGLLVISANAFPRDFVWGAATSAYQVEGAAGEDGRGESIWDRFSASGKVRAGDTGAVACDFYRRYPADVELMRELGLGGFRFSVAWPRVLPEGRGRVNQAGLDFYDRLVDTLLANGIEPFVTLYHWDLPQPLEDAGGWPERATAEAFVEYAGHAARRLGDRVTHWSTHNEPWVAAWLGYGYGILAPGRTSVDDALAASHHLLLSHAWAAQQLRAEAPGASVGIVLNLAPVEAASADPADEEAARACDGQLNRWYLDPLFRGAYPADVLERLAPAGPRVAEGDLAAIASPLDFLGVNYYSRFVVAAGSDGGLPRQAHVEGSQYTDMGWEVYPDGLRLLLTRVQREYAPAAIYVMENGAAFADVRGHDGTIRDPERTAYIAEHIEATARAIEEGVALKGYFVWSLLDNFEWLFGYWKRFGIVHVDYPTLERVPKSSFHWYRDFIAEQRERAHEQEPGEALP